MNKIDMCDYSVAYICDRDKCDICPGEGCRHTTDIDHALNFKKVEDEKYMEHDLYRNINFDRNVANAISTFVGTYPDHVDELYDAIYRVMIYLETSIWCGK